MPQDIKLKNRGLITDPNQVLEEGTDGGMVTAENVVVTRDNILQTRRGQKQTTKLGLQRGMASLWQAGDVLMGHHEQNDRVYKSTSPTSLGDAAKPYDELRMKSMESGGNVYITTTEGIKRYDSVQSNLKPAGCPPGLDGTATLSGASGFMATNTQVAYRHIWCLKDSSANLIFGAPSPKGIVSNATGGSRNVSYVLTIPDEVTTLHFCQVYRSDQSISSSAEPGEEYYLVGEVYPSSAEITAGTLTIADDTPDSLRGAVLYTSPSQEGSLAANYPPPLAGDMAEFNDCAFYARLKEKQSVDFAIIATGLPNFGYLTDASVGTTSGLATITGISSTTNLRVGMSIKCTGFNAHAKILTIDSATQITATSNSSVTNATASVTFRDFLNIGGTNFYPAAALDVANYEFLCESGLSAAENIEISAKSLIQCINQTNPAGDGQIKCYAYYASLYEDVPGKITITAREFGEDTVWLGATEPTSFLPALATIRLIIGVTASVGLVRYGTSTLGDYPDYDTIVVCDSECATPLYGARVYEEEDPQDGYLILGVTGSAGASASIFGTGYSGIQSSDSYAPNEVAISKALQREHVPVLNRLACGSQNYPILRIVPQGESLFVLKHDGTFRITGSYGAWNVSLLDSTAIIQGPDTAVAANNQVVMFSRQGVVAVSESGVRVLSRNIETELLTVSSSLYTDFSTIAFGCAYESDRQYLLGVPTETTDTCATNIYCYNFVSDSWTTWPISRSCAVVMGTEDKLYMGMEGDTEYVREERKDRTIRDYADEEYSVTITVASSGTLTVTTGFSSLEVGMTLLQSSAIGTITSITAPSTVVVDSTDFAAGSATAYTPIPVVAQYCPLTAGNPTALKRFQEVTFAFRSANFDVLTVGFSTNFLASVNEVDLTPVVSGGWGDLPWGEYAWGATLGALGQGIRTYVPRNQQKAFWLNIQLSCAQAFSEFALQGVEIMSKLVSTRIK